jgi:flagellin-like protein
MKILKSKKALSPVVASIILIAVTVAVSIAVAAWMGALSLSFMSSGEQLQLGSPWNWDCTAGTVYINVTNSGGSTIKLSSARVGNTQAGLSMVWSDNAGTSNNELALAAGEKACVQITYTSSFTPGTPYTFTIVTQNNREFQTTGVAQAP